MMEKGHPSYDDLGTPNWPIKGLEQELELELELERKPKPSQHHPFSFMRLIVSILFLAWLSISVLHRIFTFTKSDRAGVPEASSDGDVFFEDIVPNEKLEWHRCYQTFYCARLTVPMDYHRPLNASNTNPKVHIALVMAPGAHSGHKKFSKSPLLLNPGGPGGSGTMFALAFSSAIQAVIDPDQDIIGFDPRGVGATMPRADCFSYPVDGVSPGTDYMDEDYITGSFKRMLWQTSGESAGLVNSSSNSLRTLHARATAVSKLCQEKDNLHGNDSILRYVHTPSVARDMISIIDAWDEWIGTFSDNPAPCEKHKVDAPLQSDKIDALDTKGKLVYWGFSYGTLLGATFASMFPDRVGRVVLDGVVDADLYVSPVWAGSIRDADAVYDSFSSYCFDAAGACSLYRPTDKSAKDVADRLESVMMEIKEHPLTLINHRTRTPLIFTHDTLKLIMFILLYAPNNGFPVAATVADWLYRGLGELLGEVLGMPDMLDLCGPKLPVYTFPNEAQMAIMCSDKRYPLNSTVPEVQLIFEEVANMSSFADIWMTIILSCQGYSVKSVDPPMRWDDHPAHVQKPINTSFPLLFISNTYDPVTPLAAGLKMSKMFTGSGLIEQQCEGHCSLAATSICTIKALRSYFRDGTVPPPPTDDKWEKCAADDWPWHPFNAGAYAASGGDIEIQMAVQGVQELQKAFRNMDFFGPSSSILRNFDWENYDSKVTL